MRLYAPRQSRGSFFYILCVTLEPHIGREIGTRFLAQEFLARVVGPDKAWASEFQRSRSDGQFFWMRQATSLPPDSRRLIPNRDPTMSQAKSLPPNSSKTNYTVPTWPCLELGGRDLGCDIDSTLKSACRTARCRTQKSTRLKIVFCKRALNQLRNITRVLRSYSGFLGVCGYLAVGRGNPKARKNAKPEETFQKRAKHALTFCRLAVPQKVRTDP